MLKTFVNTDEYNGGLVPGNNWIFWYDDGLDLPCRTAIQQMMGINQ
jgi:hypothetical protein